MKVSSVEILYATGVRLEKEWTTSKETRRNQRSEDEDSFKMRKLLKKSLHTLLSNLHDGYGLPSWMKDRPLYTFNLRLQYDWGPQVTDLHEAAKTKSNLDHTHIDEIALLSGIVHINKSHSGFSAKDITRILSEILHAFYSQGMEDDDMQRAQDATVLWTSWVQIWKSLLLKEKLAAWKNTRDPGDVDVEPVAILTSESDCMMAVVGLILQEIMEIQHIINSNACTSAGKPRKTKLPQGSQSRQPDIVGQTRDKKEVFYGELKGPHPSPAAVSTDLLEIFSKDALDQLHHTLEQGPPLVNFQTVGRDVTFFLGAKINNTVVHVRLSTVKLPSRMTELDLDLDLDFFRTFSKSKL
ncbi:hypothetical protein KI688_011016 [Linnemannia hyalina]|uniref:Uncharacterized protein n=1 Tax=Linnemannia hyalina TaxID=64524 RepID=A0A9P7XY20_9FUNG|nr:hypothetical protein KI688_011016 [Linnemannia hyalina]